MLNSKSVQKVQGIGMLGCSQILPQHRGIRVSRRKKETHPWLEVQNVQNVLPISQKHMVYVMHVPLYCICIPTEQSSMQSLSPLDRVILLWWKRVSSPQCQDSMNYMKHLRLHLRHGKCQSCKHLNISYGFSNFLCGLALICSLRQIKQLSAQFRTYQIPAERIALPGLCV